MTDEHRTYRTGAGRILTDADIQALADEAERGYNVGHLLVGRRLARLEHAVEILAGAVSSLEAGDDFDPFPTDVDRIPEILRGEVDAGVPGAQPKGATH